MTNFDRGREALLAGGVGRKEQITICGGEKCSLYGSDGREYLDFTSQAWSYTVGINHPRVREAVIRQINIISHLRTSFDSDVKLILSDKLTRINKELCKVNYALHGSNSIEGAVKLSLNRRKGPIMVLEHGFHGRTIFTHNLSWDKYILDNNIITVPEAYCYRCKFSLEYPICNMECLNNIENIIKKSNPSTFIMEVVQGNGGQICFPPEFVCGMRDLCDMYDITFILDDIQCGFGRCGVLLGSELFNIIPDIVVFGKALGGGYPISGFLCKDMFSFKSAQHSFTFSHFPVSMAASVATLDVIKDENIIEQATCKGAYLTKKLTFLKDSYDLIGDVRGPGLMIGVELVLENNVEAAKEAQFLVSYAMENGVIFGVSKHSGLGNVIKFKPPAVVTYEEIDRAVDVFEQGLKLVERIK